MKQITQFIMIVMMLLSAMTGQAQDVTAKWDSKAAQKSQMQEKCIYESDITDWPDTKSSETATDFELKTKYTNEKFKVTVSEIQMGGFGKAVSATDPSAIESVTAANTGDRIYNLAGQRLKKAVKGINIIGGKKVVVK